MAYDTGDASGTIIRASDSGTQILATAGGDDREQTGVHALSSMFVTIETMDSVSASLNTGLKQAAQAGWV